MEEFEKCDNLIGVSGLNELSEFSELTDFSKLDKLDAMSFVKNSFNTISDFYQDKIVFVTGFTGTIGKLVTEKLLRSCNVRQVVVLVRARRSKNIAERVEEVLESEVRSISFIVFIASNISLISKAIWTIEAARPFLQG